MTVRKSFKTRISAMVCALVMSIMAFSAIIAEAATLVCREDLGSVSSGAGFNGEQLPKDRRNAVFFIFFK